MQYAPILYAEDSDDDVILLQRAFVRAQLPHPLVTLRDGRAAQDYLHAAANGSPIMRATRPMPRLVLLDIKMPYLSGLEVLRWIRANPSFAGLPVLMLSSSAADRDIEPAFQAGANGYLVKPHSLAGLDALVAGLKGALGANQGLVASGDWGAIKGGRLPTAAIRGDARALP
jgi:two-component system response regulator